jgi:hypothetical protein
MNSRRLREEDRMPKFAAVSPGREFARSQSMPITACLFTTDPRPVPAFAAR